MKHATEEAQARTSEDHVGRFADLLRTMEGGCYFCLLAQPGVLCGAGLLHQDKVPLKEKLDQIMRWVDLPLDNRPQLIMGMPTEYLDMDVLNV